MQTTYGLAVVKDHGLVALKLPAMTLDMAEKTRKRLDLFATIRGLNVVVVNFAAQ